MNKEEKLALYYEAKRAYYESEPIIGDSEFDALEEELGLSNKSIIGAGSTPNYTIKHPFIMGSLSKVQIKANDFGNVNWFNFADEILPYLKRVNCDLPFVPCIVTPKYDGCSYEFHYNNGEIAISTRGDGDYGKDIKKHLEKKCSAFVGAVKEKEFTLRGEVLIKKRVFSEKYSSFTNPRSFVAGILNRKFDDIVDKSILDDLSIVIYDYRTKNNGEWIDRDWTELQDSDINDLLPQKYTLQEFDGVSSLIDIYKEELRNTKVKK